MHAQLTALLSSSPPAAGDPTSTAAHLSTAHLSMAHAAVADLATSAGMPPHATATAASLHAQQAALAEARCRERFERRALEEFVKQSLSEELPPPPAFEPSGGKGGKSGEGVAGGENEGGGDGTSDEEELERWLLAASEMVGGDGGLAELQARVQMLNSARRSHAEAWAAMAEATRERVESLRTLKLQLSEANGGEGGGDDAATTTTATTTTTTAATTACGDGMSTPRAAPLVAVHGLDTPIRPGSLRRQQSDLLRVHSSQLVDAELAKEEAALSGYGAEEQSIHTALTTRLQPLLTCVVSTCDAFSEVDGAARAAMEDEKVRVPLGTLREAMVAMTAIGAVSPEGVRADTPRAAVDVSDGQGDGQRDGQRDGQCDGSSSLPALSSVLSALESVLGGLGGVRTDLSRRREVRMAKKAEKLAKARKELDALEPQREAALRRAEAQRGAERAAMDAELRQVRGREEAQSPQISSSLLDLR